MTITSQEVFQALLLDVLKGFEISPRFANQPGSKALGRMALAASIGKMLVEVESGIDITLAGAQQRISDEWNRLIAEREAEVKEGIANEMERLRAMEAQLQAGMRKAQQSQHGGVWQRYEQPEAPPT